MTLDPPLPSAAEPHRIRLQGPWEAGPAGAPRRVPFEQLAAVLAAAEAVDPHSETLWCLARNFRQPLNLPPGTRVRLVCEGLRAGIALDLDGVPLYATEPGTFDLTERLRPQNRLTLTGRPGREPWVAAVRLEFFASEPNSAAAPPFE